MKASKFNEEKIAMALHMAEQTSVDEVTRKLGIAQATFYRWKSKYGGSLPAEVMRVILRTCTPHTINLTHKYYHAITIFSVFFF